MRLPWPTEFVTGVEALPPWESAAASDHKAATIAMFFNLECPGCVSRGVPFLKRLGAAYGDKVSTVLVHTSYGHRLLGRGEVVPTLVRFANDYARLSMPVALDLSGNLARAWGVEGTPHTYVFDGKGELQRSLFGSQDNARTRIEYLLEELTSAAVS